MKTAYLVSNSPGEVTTFVRPVAEALAQRHPDWELQVALVPCPYATGAETSVIQGWSSKTKVWTPWQTVKAWINAQGRGKSGVICFLGGDPWHALLLKSRFEMPVVGYFHIPSSWESTRWRGGFDSVAIGYEQPQQDWGPGLRSPIGDLRVDAVSQSIQSETLLLEGQVKPKEQTLAIFPGSRWLHLKAVLGPFLHAAENVVTEDRPVRLVLSASPFVSRRQLADAAGRPLKLGLASTTAELRKDNMLVTERGTQIEVVWGRPHHVIARCDLALSLPGTNTAELAIGEKLTVVPLSSRVPVGGGGLLGILDRLPGLTSLKRKLRENKAERVRFTSIPNQLAGRVVAPEFMVRDDLSDLIDNLAHLLDNAAERQRMAKESREVMGPKGAADRFLDMVDAVVG